MTSVQDRRVGTGAPGAGPNGDSSTDIGTDTDTGDQAEGFLSRLWRAWWLLMFVPPLCWAGNFVIGRAVGGGAGAVSFPPLSLWSLRWSLALVILVALCAPTLWRQRAAIRRHWRLIAVCGVFGVAGYNSFVYLALQTVPVANAALVNSVVPVLIPAFAWIVTRERVGPVQAGGIALSLAGVAWIVGRGDLSTLAGFRFAPGDLWMLVAVVNWAIFSILLRYKPAEIAPLPFLAASIPFGLVVVAPFWALELAAGRMPPVSWEAAAVVGYVALFASVFAFICWSRCVALIGPTRTGLTIHLQPAFAVVLAWLALGEGLHGYHLVGLLFIAAGVVLGTVVGRRGA